MNTVLIVIGVGGLIAAWGFWLLVIQSREHAISSSTCYADIAFVCDRALLLRMHSEPIDESMMWEWYRHPDLIAEISWITGYEGIAVRLKPGVRDDGINVGVFVALHLRRQGIGTRLLRSLEWDWPIVADTCTPMREAFYNAAILSEKS